MANVCGARFGQQLGIGQYTYSGLGVHCERDEHDGTVSHLSGWIYLEREDGTTVGDQRPRAVRVEWLCDPVPVF